MWQPCTGPFVYSDPVPPPFSLGPALPTTSPLDATLQEIALIEMASPTLALASVMWKANFDDHGSFPILILPRSPNPDKSYES